MIAGLTPRAHADTLVDHVEGTTFTATGAIDRFTGLLVGSDGRVIQVLHRGDKRPRADYAVDGHGATLLPGLISGPLPFIGIGLAAIAPPDLAAGTGPLPPPRPEDRDLAVSTAQALLLARGITTVTDVGATIEDWQSYRRLGDLGQLQIRLLVYAAGTQQMAVIGGPRPSPWLYDDRLKFNGVWLDAGAAGGATSPESAPAIQLKNWMSRGAIDHFQVAVRIDPPVGSGPARTTSPQAAMVAHAIDELSQTYKGDRRWRVEALPARMPMTAPEPLAAMAGVLDRLAVLRAATLDAAQAGFAEEHLGRLAPGLRADFILVDHDPQLASADELRQMRVLETWVNGRKVYEAGHPPAAGAGPEPTRGTGAEGR